MRGTGVQRGHVAAAARAALLVLAIICLGIVVAARDAAHAQTNVQVTPVRPAPAPSASNPPAPSNARADQANDAVIMLMAGRPDAEFVKVADDIALVASDGTNVRVLPVIGDGGAQNIRDLVLLRNVDLALTQVAVLNRMAAAKDLSRTLDRQILYITPLFQDEMHVLVRADVKTFADLAGRRVNFGTEGSGTDFMMGPMLESLGIKVKRMNMGQTEAVERMRRGELDATVCICLKPVAAFAGIRPEWGLRLIPVPFTNQLEREFLPARLVGADYPNLLKEQDKIDTVALQSVLVTFNWPKNSVRYNKVARFVEAMFSRFKEFGRPGRNERWAGVNLAASLPGWQRFPAAQEWLDSNAQTASNELRKDFSRFINDAPQGERTNVTQPTSAAAPESERLFREFLQWRKERRD